MGYIDLHVHSNYSDGSCSPTELVQMACEKGLYAFALTDQDSVEGIPAAIQAAIHSPVYVIPGIEITSALGGRPVHILGYGIDIGNPGLYTALMTIGQFRDERNVKICSQLRTYGIDIDYDSIKNTFGCRLITRSHLAGFLVQHGYAADIRDAFDKYLAKGKPCYIPMRRLSTEDAVRLILRAGGIAVCAHPVLYHMNDTSMIQLLSLLRTFGVRGIEAIHSANTMEDEMKYKAMARELDMFITGGSDFRGVLRPDVDLGTGRGNLMIPQSILNDLNRY